jgi:hypothetical protein
MHTGIRLLLGLTLAVALAACSSGSGTTDDDAGLGSGGTPTTSPPTAEPVPDVMTGGRYLFGPVGDTPAVNIVATGPDGWVGYPSWAMDGPEPLRADAPNGIGVAFFTAKGVYRDVCHWDALGRGTADIGGVVPGPTVDDLVATLRANRSYTSSVATPVTIDGYAGKELELQLPDGPYTNCDKDDPNDPGGHEFVFSGPGLYAQGPGNRWHLYILDVDGTRLIAVILSYAKTPRTDLDLARNIIETLDINP